MFWLLELWWSFKYLIGEVTSLLTGWMSQLTSEPNLPDPDWLYVLVQDETTVVESEKSELLTFNYI